MAIGWFTVLKSVPWTAVISNAPVVADGAKKLWKTVANKGAAQQPAEPSQAPAPTASEPADESALQQQLTRLQADSSRFEEQMLASSELINALAEQNTQLIALVEANRVRTLWLSRATALLAVIAIGALALLLLHVSRA